MAKKIMVAPSILSGDFANMGDSVAKLDLWGADIVHCDVMDGVYVKNITFGMPMIKAIKKYTKLPLDVHLMITKPENYVEAFIDAGADYLTFHPEASDKPEKVLELIAARGVKPGIVINADIPCEPWMHLVDYCSIVLVMSVQAGLGGQKFQEQALKKVEMLKNYIDKRNLITDIEIDGGINEENACAARNAGANILVAGSAVFNSKNPANTIKIIRGN